MKQYVLPEESLQKTLNYLSSRPFGEVAALIAALQQNAKEFKPAEAAPSEPTEPPTTE